jgi:uncharacterized protein with HEPN domain
MEDELKSCLEDILHSISLIDIFLESISSFEQYQQNLMLKSAVERKIEIKGEALNKALKIDTTLNISNTRKIVDMRNKLIHSYDDIDDIIVWTSVKNTCRF